MKNPLVGEATSFAEQQFANRGQGGQGQGGQVDLLT
jgi:hypothetical protein